MQNFTLIKDKYFYPTALDVYQRFENMKQEGDQPEDDELQPQISKQSK